jgi:hypothetical protein
MGFNKRFVNEEIIRTVLREDGFQSLIDFIKKPDALIIEDEFSTKVCEIIRENEEKYILEKLLKIF